MSNRFLEIDKFLKDFDNIYSSNPSLEISMDTLYFYLSRFGMNPSELKDRDIRDNFQKWIDRNKNKQNLDVFWSKRQPGFLQFHNGKHYGKEYKIYLSFPKEQIFDCVNKVFDYMEEHNILHCSKVANSVRSDDVVLRVVNSEDIPKIMNFINNDPMLAAYSKPRNPFLMQSGITSFSYDDNLSFNSTLSIILKKYFEYCRKENLLGKNVVSLEHLKTFSSKLYNDIFINCSKLKEFDLEGYGNERNFSSKGAKLNNYEQVFRLINYSLNTDFDINSYIGYVEDCRNNSKNKDKINYYDEVIKANINDDTKVNEKKEYLDKYIFTALKLYGKENISKYLNLYLSGNIKAITRTNNFREVFSSKITPDDVFSLTNGDISSYINSVLIEKAKTDKQKNDEINRESFNRNNYLFYNACLATYEKYGLRHLNQAIASALNGDFKYFTNGKYSYRKILTEYFRASDVKIFCIDFLEKSGIDFDSSREINDVICDIITENYNNDKKKNSSVR